MNVLELQNVTSIEPPANDEAVADWLAKQANTTRPFLLAYADDGIIWGRWQDNRLWTSHEVALDTPSAGVSPALLGITLQQAFVFGVEGEVRLYRDELGQWQARHIVDDDQNDRIVEDQILLGDQVIRTIADHFTHLYDRKQQGLDQIVPITVTSQDFAANRRPRLRIHHFLTYDLESDEMQLASGEARIALSRLVDVGVWADDQPEEAQ